MSQRVCAWQGIRRYSLHALVIRVKGIVHQRNAATLFGVRYVTTNCGKCDEGKYDDGRIETEGIYAGEFRLKGYME